MATYNSIATPIAILKVSSVVRSMGVIMSDGLSLSDIYSDRKKTINNR